MPLYRATALIAVLLIVLLSAGYAAAERDEANSRVAALTPNEVQH